MKTAAQKIVYYLWFDTQADEAVQFYTSIFPKSQLLNRTVLEGTPSGDCPMLDFELWGQRFGAISAGPYFKFNTSLSFMVNFDPLHDAQAESHLREVWDALATDGKIVMPLGAQDFSPLYGWIEDRYGLSWQLILTDPDGPVRPPIMPVLSFPNDPEKNAKQAIDFYLSVFHDAALGDWVGYGEEAEGATLFSDFQLEKQWFVALDQLAKKEPEFNEAVSFMVYCETQEEIDYYWDKLSAVPEAEACGWLKDSFGISWQINPRVLDEWLFTGTHEQIQLLNQAVLKMKKIELAKLQGIIEK